MTIRTRTVRIVVLAVVGSFGLGGCTAAEATPLQTVTQNPTETVTVISDSSDEVSSFRTSRAIFAQSPVAVVAPTGDPRTQALAAQASVELGVPLLVAPADSSGDVIDPDDALSRELTRLGVSSVVAVGNVARWEGEVSAAATGEDLPFTVVRVAATAAAVGVAAGLSRGIRISQDAAVYATEVAALSPGAAPGHRATAQVPAFVRDEILDGTVAISVDSPKDVPAIATARAAGVEVLLVPASAPNPQGSASVIDALHKSDARKTLALGAQFTTESRLDWKIRSARSGLTLPGGGQLLFPAHQFVAIYGTPGTGSLGILGEQDVAAAVQRAKDVAAPYQALTDKTVVPMFEIIATVAAGNAGADGDYSNELDLERMRQWIVTATAAGIYVVIDLQPGRTDFLAQAKLYQSLLELPHVGLALDPEWRLEADQVPLEQIGSVSAAEVNSVVTWLADLTNERGLPQKMLVLHQFQLRMLQDRASIDVSRPELALLIHADGQGTQPDKRATWNALHVGAPEGIAWGWKNFYDEDKPMLTPEQTAGVSPVPDLITYQ